MGDTELTMDRRDSGEKRYLSTQTAQKSKNASWNLIPKKLNSRN